MTKKLIPGQSVAIMGLGIMGSALARNLITDGLDVSGFDPDLAASQKATEGGVEAASTVLEAVRGAHFILSSLPSEAALLEVVSALTKCSPELQSKVILIELSTLSIDSKAEARQRLAEYGVDMLDCPISGTGAQAHARDIVLYASGNEEAFMRCQPLFDAISREAFFLGEFGNGMRMKFIANLLVAIHNVASAEALCLARQAGLNPQQVYDVISSGAGNSRIFELRGPMMVKDSFEPATMKLDVWQKDMELIRAFAQSAGAETPLFDATEPLYEMAIKMDLGDLDTAAVCRVIDRLGRSN